MRELPSGWAEATVGDLFSYVRGVTYSKSDASKSEDENRKPVLRANNFNQQFDLSDLVYLPSELVSDEQHLQVEDLLFAMSSGSKSHVGKCIRVKQEIVAGFGAFCGVLRPIDLIFSRLFSHAFQTGAFRNYIEELAAGTNINNLKRDMLLGYKIVVPPLNEQRRIVDKVETLFDEIDKGVESLQVAKNTLGFYRQSLLKSAFEGRLTVDWREKNADKLEKPEMLLARIQSEREIRHKAALDDWQEALDDWRAGGEVGKKPVKPKLPKNFDAELNESLAVPAAWITVMLAGVAFEAVLGKMLDRQKNRGSPRPYIGNINLRWGTFDVDYEKTLPIEEHEVHRYGIKTGDLIICEGGEPGRCAVWHGKDNEVFIQKALHRVRFTESYVANFAYYFLKFATMAGLLNKHYTGSTIKHLTGRALNEVLLPICSPAEQNEIIRLLDEKFEAADALETEIDAGLARAAALRQSILKKAFSGQLVSQDPEDEPASELLARIKVEKAEKERAAMRERKTTASRKPKTKVRRPTLTNLIEVLKKQNGWISASKAAQELGVFDGASSDDVEAFYRQLKEHLQNKDETIKVERRGDEDWLRLDKAEVS